MEIIVVGCGRVGAELAYRLFEKKHTVTVVDHMVASFENLNQDFRGRTIEGEAMNKDILRRAGVHTAQGLAAVTSSDSLNVVVGHIAKTVYKIPNVVARNYDARYRYIHEAFGLQVVSSSSWGAQRIEELLYHQEMRTVFSAGNGEVELYEFTIPSVWEGHKLEDILPSSECNLAALTRVGRAILPECQTVLQAGDVVLVSATMNGIEALRSLLNAIQEA